MNRVNLILRIAACAVAASAMNVLATNTREAWVANDFLKPQTVCAVTTRKFRLNILEVTNGPTINEIELLNKQL
ncbi:MAG: hypothetical protein WDN00_08025 [Limisphaerales bacterium]